MQILELALSRTLTRFSAFLSLQHTYASMLQVYAFLTMSSPRTTDAPNKAGALRHRDSSSLLPLLSILNVFRKKPIERTPTYDEPCEVAPGV